MSGRPFDRRRRRSRRSDRWRVVFVLVLLMFLEFYLRPSLFESHAAPDFLLLVLLLLAIRERPGAGAFTGFIIGLVIDALTPARFGAGILAHVLVGWGAAWGRGLFFADNLLVNAALFFVGTWVRDLLVLLFSGTPLHALPSELLVWAPLQALTTAIAGVIVVAVFRDWLAIRIDG
ncbi:MAG TPA: rod shape-determining protein MreD [Gemmatimonadales bacterium]|jgi:rod shape-determining protein MreD